MVIAKFVCLHEIADKYGDNNALDNVSFAIILSGYISFDHRLCCQK
jgi:hypothetical protein